MIIKIKNFRLKTIIGIHKWEQKIKRDIIINLKIVTDDNRSVIKDDIKETIDYEYVSNQIRNIVDKEHFGLVEAMAERIISEIMKDNRIKECDLEIDKLGALPDIESFSVTLHRKQK